MLLNIVKRSLMKMVIRFGQNDYKVYFIKYKKIQRDRVKLLYKTVSQGVLAPFHNSPNQKKNLKMF